MKVALIPVVLVILAFSAQAEDTEVQKMVGVLMDATCPVIAGGSRHSDTPVRAASAKRVRTAAHEGTRGRSAAHREKEPDRYDACKATTATTDFAIHTDGQLLVLDETGNDVVRQHMRNDSFRASMADESGSARWLTVMVEGRRNGEKLSLISLRR